jgi:hypothetical protein
MNFSIFLHKRSSALQRCWGRWSNWITWKNQTCFMISRARYFAIERGVFWFRPLIREAWKVLHRKWREVNHVATFVIVYDRVWIDWAKWLENLRSLNCFFLWGVNFFSSGRIGKIVFDVDRIINQPFKNDEVQSKYFVIDSFEQLFDSVRQLTKSWK